MVERGDFYPDWASSPGATVSDILAQNGMSLGELARKLQLPSAAVQSLIEGQEPIGPETANSLATVLGASTNFWLSREKRYRGALASIEARWLDALPLEDMSKFGWIGTGQHPVSVAALLDYFDVPSISAWRANYGMLERLVAFRMSPSFESHPAAVAAWLRQGEIEALALRCKPWSRRRFIELLPQIRALTRLRQPQHFLPRLRQYCTECGVAVAVVRAPDGCRASGAARFLSEPVGVIQLSFRYLTDDHFWFTFFHEAGHLVLHGDKGLYLEGTESTSTEDEDEANDFAARNLIPQELQAELRSLHANTFEVIRFASKAGIAPGIVVGQLQHLEIIPPNYLNRLKRRYQWEGSRVAQPRKAT